MHERLCLIEGMAYKQCSLETELVPTCVWFLESEIVVGYGMVTLGGLYYILFKMSNSFSTICNHTKHLTLIEFLVHKNVTPIGIHHNMLAFYGEDTEDINSVHSGVRKSWDNGRNVDLNDQFQSGSPVTAFHNLNSQKSQTLLRKLMNFGESHSGTVKH